MTRKSLRPAQVLMAALLPAAFLSACLFDNDSKKRGPKGIFTPHGRSLQADVLEGKTHTPPEWYSLL